MKTLLVNLYGGPGTGKSTSAAYLYAIAKMAGINAELVREAAKEYAWREEVPKQIPLLKEQIARENLVFGKVALIVTDSPLYIGQYYTHKFGTLKDFETVIRMIKKTRLDRDYKGHDTLNIFLKRDKPYNPAGRFEGEKEAKQVDKDQRKMLETLHIPFYDYNTEKEDLHNLFTGLIVSRIKELNK